MSSFFSFLSVGMVCLTVFGLAFMVVLAMPQSRMRDVCKKVLLAIGCVIYIVSPVDFMPEMVLGPIGLLDDLAALTAAIVSTRSALRMAA